MQNGSSTNFEPVVNKQIQAYLIIFTEEGAIGKKNYNNCNRYGNDTEARWFSFIFEWELVY